MALESVAVLQPRVVLGSGQVLVPASLMLSMLGMASVLTSVWAVDPGLAVGSVPALVSVSLIALVLMLA